MCALMCCIYPRCTAYSVVRWVTWCHAAPGERELDDRLNVEHGPAVIVMGEGRRQGHTSFDITSTLATLCAAALRKRAGCSHATH